MWIAGLLLSLLSCALGRELPKVSGDVVTLTNTSAQMYMPYTLRRSRLPQDGPNSFLVADSSALVKMSAPVGENIYYTVSQLAGHPVITGYVDDAAADARFSHISDFVQSRNGSLVYIADQNNHCIRLFDRSLNTVTEYVGNCTEYGQYTGARLDARLSSPTGLALTKDYTGLYIADRQNNRILKLDLVSQEHWVETVIDNSFPEKSRVILPTSIALGPNEEHMYLTTENGLMQISNYRSNDTGYPVKHAYGTGVHDATLLGLTLIEGGQFAVVPEYNGNRLIFVDLQRGGAAQMCTGQLTLPLNRTDGSSQTCEFNSPQGVAVIDSGAIFVTEYRSRVIRRAQYSLPSTGFTPRRPTTTTPFTLPTSTPESPRPPRPTSKPEWKPTAPEQEVTSGFWVWKPPTEEPAKAQSPLVLGLSVGLLVPLVLIGGLVGLVFYIKIKGQRDAAKMFNRRSEQGGYDGPQLQFDDPRFNKYNTKPSAPNQPSASNQPSATNGPSGYTSSLPTSVPNQYSYQA
ncbi:uncharacterized protein [Watersipora subatra]|uniref:uncharacterized protein n=1 Tax=Watersipora subatra TaxID=2589382 RepID=UPI00355C5D7C